MSGPRIPSRDELNGREIDRLTESAVNYTRLADQHGAHTEMGKWYRNQAKNLKEAIAEERKNPLF